MRTIAAAVPVLACVLLSGCVGRPAVLPPAEFPGQSQSGASGAASLPEAETEEPVNTGLSLYASVADSRDAAGSGDGTAQMDLTLTAVTVDHRGIITDCVLDQLKTQASFDAAGQLTSDVKADFPTKQELGDAYAMAQASSIGREWDQQAAAMADYARGKTVEQLKTMAVNAVGAPVSADLASSVTISVADFVAGIEAAVSSAQDLGAHRGDQLALSASASMAGSQNAAAEQDGLAQTQVSAAAVTFDGDQITSCALDAIQVEVRFNGSGVLTTDLTAFQPSKNQLGEAYGMKAASTIGKEWNEQAAAFGAYAVGKTAQEVAALAVDERTSPLDADLISSVTIAVGDFQGLIEKAAHHLGQ